jgi:hypothetical protein
MHYYEPFCDRTNFRNYERSGDLYAFVVRKPTWDGSSVWFWRVRRGWLVLAEGVESDRLIAELRASVRFEQERTGIGA